MDPFTALGLAFSLLKLALEIRRYLREKPDLPAAITTMLEGAAVGLERDANQLRTWAETHDPEAP